MAFACRRVLAALVLLLAGTAAARAQTVPVFVNGQIITAQSLNAAFAAIEAQIGGISCVFTPCPPATPIVNSSIFYTDGSGHLFFGTTLPSGLTYPSPIFTGTITGGTFAEPTITNPAINGGTIANLAINGGTIANLAAPLGATSGGTGINNGAFTLTLGSSATLPALTGSHGLLYDSAAGTLGNLATGNNGVLVTSSGGVPLISSTLPSVVQGNILSGGINPLASAYGAPTNGTSDASTALSSACTAAATAGTPLLIDIKYAILSTITLSCDLQFGRGGSLAVSTSHTLTHQGYISAPRGAYIFTGAGTVTTTSSYRSVAWWGALALQAASSDPQPAIQAAFGGSCSNTYVDLAAGQYVFLSAPEVPGYPALDNTALKIRGCANSTFDFRGASMKLATAVASNSIIEWENDTQIHRLGGNFIGNRTGVSSSTETSAECYISVRDFNSDGAVYSGDWNTLGAPICGNFIDASHFDIAEEDNVGIGADLAQVNASDFIIHKTTGATGSAAFSSIWDMHFAVTTSLTAQANSGASSITVPNLTISAVADNGSGVVRLTVPSTANIVSGTYNVSGFTGSYANLNFTWYPNVIDSTHVDLLGSTFAAGTVAGSPVIAPSIANGDPIAIGSAQGGYQYETVTSVTPSSGVLTLGISPNLPATALVNTYVTDLFYNQTGTNFVEGTGNRVTILKDYGGFNVGVVLASGGWTVDGDLSNNAGGSVAGLGVFLTYYPEGTSPPAGGNFPIVGHPLGATVLRGRYANNGNGTHGGCGIEIANASITNGVDQMGPITIGGVQLDNNNTTGICATAASGNVYGLSIDSPGLTGSGASQTTLVNANAQELADPPPSIGSFSGLGTGGSPGVALYGTGTGHGFTLQLTTGSSGTAGSGGLYLTFPNTGNSGGMTFGWACTATQVAGASQWVTPNIQVTLGSATAISIDWWNGTSGGTALTVSSSYHIAFNCWHT
jgi:hypothetical protein